jgi:hypothetical protein
MAEILTYVNSGLILLLVVGLILVLLLTKKEAKWEIFATTPTASQVITNSTIYTYTPTAATTYTFTATKKYDIWSVINDGSSVATIKYGTSTKSYPLPSKSAATFISDGDKFSIVSGKYA